MKISNTKYITKDGVVKNNPISIKKILEDSAVKEFGITEDIQKGNFILTDGTILDFSWKQGGGKLQHANIARIFTPKIINMLPEYYRDKIKPYSPESAIQVFFQLTNAIRITNGLNLEFSKNPTKAQKSTISRIYLQLRREGRTNYIIKPVDIIHIRTDYTPPYPKRGTYNEFKYLHEFLNYDFEGYEFPKE